MARPGADTEITQMFELQERLYTCRTAEFGQSIGTANSEGQWRPGNTI